MSLDEYVVGPNDEPGNPDGQRWLVAGWADADWVKNVRASGSATLTKGTPV